MIKRFEDFGFELDTHEGENIVHNHPEGDIIMNSLNNTLGDLTPVERTRGAHREKIYTFWIRKSDLEYTDVEEQPKFDRPHWLDYKRKQSFQEPKFKGNVKDYALLLTVDDKVVVDKKIWSVLMNVFELSRLDTEKVLSWYLSFKHSIGADKIGESY